MCPFHKCHDDERQKGKKKYSEKSTAVAMKMANWRKRSSALCSFEAANFTYKSRYNLWHFMFRGWLFPLKTFRELPSSGVIFHECKQVRRRRTEWGAENKGIEICINFRNYKKSLFWEITNKDIDIWGEIYIKVKISVFKDMPFRVPAIVTSSSPSSGCRPQSSLEKKAEAGRKRVLFIRGKKYISWSCRLISSFMRTTYVINFENVFFKSPFLITRDGRRVSGNLSDVYRFTYRGEVPGCRVI